MRNGGDRAWYVLIYITNIRHVSDIRDVADVGDIDARHVALAHAIGRPIHFTRPKREPTDATASSSERKRRSKVVAAQKND